MSKFSPDSRLRSVTRPPLTPLEPLEPQEGGYLLGHDGDLDKADEEEDERGARHVGTESVIHLLGVLRGREQSEGRGTGPSAQALPHPTRPGRPTPRTRKTREPGLALALGKQVQITIRCCLWAGVELCQSRNFLQTDRLESDSRSWLKLPSTVYTPGHRRHCAAPKHTRKPAQDCAVPTSERVKLGLREVTDLPRTTQLLSRVLTLSPSSSHNPTSGRSRGGLTQGRWSKSAP